METKRCIFCMQEIDFTEERCPHCKKAVWEYEWKPGWIRPYTVLQERYMIGQALGEGAFGVTYLAYDDKEKRSVAIKAYSQRENESSQEKAEADLLDEIKDIPGVVNKTGYFQENGAHYLVMEYLKGGSLRNYLKKRHHIPAEEAVKILQPVMQTLIRLHGRGIIHGDISPDNLLFDGEGTLKIIDFGAALIKGYPAREKKLKEGYAPMESYQEKDKIGPWSDLYAVCAVWYEAVTGHKVPAAPQRVKRDHIRVPSDFVKVPDQMEQAFMRGLSVDIQSRYFSIVNLLHQLDLQEETDDEKESAAIRKIWGDSWIRITTEVERVSAKNRKRGRFRSRLKKILCACAALILVVLLARAGIQWYRTTHPEKVVEEDLKNDREAAEEMKKPEIRGQDSKEFKEAVKFLEKNAYKVDRDEVYTTYWILKGALKGWKYPSEEAGIFPVKITTMEKVIDLYMNENRETEQDTFYGTIMLNKNEQWSPLYVALEQSEQWIYGESRVEISSDYVTGFVTELRFTSKKRDEAEAFLYKMLPILSPESYLTEDEIKELFHYLDQHRNKGMMIDLNRKCNVRFSYESADGTYNVTVGVNT
ncbi:MAG TPA: serine/threonine protein kinase [Candidatus Anaerostipes avicola]|nr:serine/threonine-protein kinase [uncultured Anaerostipes sp.]HJC82700.1 serine/threonine protein kinase [Candidatus Anaerostipes avicola]